MSLGADNNTARIGWTCTACGCWVPTRTWHVCPGSPTVTPVTYTWSITPAICGIVSYSGAKGEPLACGFPAGHAGNHAWATLPTFTQVEHP